MGSIFTHSLSKTCQRALLLLLAAGCTSTADDIGIGEKEPSPWNLVFQADLLSPTVEEKPDYVVYRIPVWVDLERLKRDEPLTADLGDGWTYLFTPVEREIRGRERFTWRGEIHSQFGVEGSATFTVDGERIRGSLRLGWARYQVVSSSDGRTWLDEIDSSYVPPPHPSSPIVPEEDHDPFPELAPATPLDMDEDTSVDIIVFYTQAAISFYADEADLRLAIRNAVDMANTAYLNSAVPGRLRLIGIFPYDFEEDPDDGPGDLAAFRSDPWVQYLMDLYSADLGALIGDYSGAFCGLGYVLTHWTTQWDWGYSLTSAAPVCLGRQTLAHETGHNMGLHHDPDNIGNREPEDLIAPFAMAHFEDWEFRTIMSYWNMCPGATSLEQYNAGCPQIDHFSDPEVLEPVSGLPTGVEDERNNAEVLRLNMPNVKQWRQQPTSLAEAAGDSSGDYETGGDGLWVSQNEFTYEEKAALVSGPVHQDDVSWLRLEHGQTGEFLLEFSGRVDAQNPNGWLELSADGETIATFNELSEAWQVYSVSIPGSTKTLEWTWRTDAGNSADDIGVVILAGVSYGYFVGGTVSGLESSDLVIQNNGAYDLEIEEDGAFSFDTLFKDQALYDVSVLSHPSDPRQFCVIDNESGVVDGHDVTSIEITCYTDSFTVGGTVSGLKGSGLVIQNKADDDLDIDEDGAFTFQTPIEDQTSYEVTVLSQPSGPSQTCAVTGGTGTLDGDHVTNVEITCQTDYFTIGGTVSGLEGSGLVLQNNGTDDLAIDEDGVFTLDTPLEDLTSYEVTVLSRPSNPSQTCAVTGGTGTVDGADITSIEITCQTDSFSVGGTVSGLEGSGLALRNNGADDLAIYEDGSFTFETSLEDHTSYDVTVLTQPSNPSQTCAVTSGTGTIDAADVTTVDVSCEPPEEQDGNGAGDEKPDEPNDEPAEEEDDEYVEEKAIIDDEPGCGCSTSASSPGAAGLTWLLVVLIPFFARRPRGVARRGCRTQLPS